MRLITYMFCMLLIFLMVIPSFAQTTTSLDNAQQAYDAGNFDAAIQFFELTISGGIYNGEIFYNVANAHYQQGDIGTALLNYNRALQYIPRDLDLNIQIARTRALRNIPTTDTTHPIILIEQLTATTVTINELSIVTLSLWSLFWILIALYQVKHSWHNTLKFAIRVMLTIILGFGILLGSRLYMYHAMPPAVITIGSAPVYSGPSISYFRQYDLFEGAEIYITDTQDEWSKFVTADNRIGWVQTDTFQKVHLD